MMMVKEKRVEEGYEHNTRGRVVLRVGSQPRCIDKNFFLPIIDC